MSDTPGNRFGEFFGLCRSARPGDGRLISRRILLIALLLACLFNLAPGFARAKPLKVGLFLEEPFASFDSSNKLGGMAVDLWEQVAANLGYDYEYQYFGNFGQMLSSLRDGEIDLSAAHISVTYNRAREFKFSFPWFDAGLGILASAEQRTVWEELKANGQVRTYIRLTALLLALTVALTVVRRRIHPEFTRKWPEGLARSFHDLILAAKSGHFNFPFKGWLGYVVSAVWMLFGVALIAYILSTVTSAMTTVSLDTGINSVYDLPGKKVGAINGSIGEEFLRQMGIEPIPFNNIEQSAEAVMARTIQAAVSDAPQLEYAIYKLGSDKLRMAGGMFWRVKYAFAGRPGSEELLDEISLELIRLHEREKINELKEKYFGPGR